MVPATHFPWNSDPGREELWRAGHIPRMAITPIQLCTERHYMEWLELINVDAVGPKSGLSALERCSSIRVPKAARLMFYMNSLGNSFSIHIRWNSQYAPRGGKSSLGKELSQTLSDIGLVSHSIWMETDQLPEIPQGEQAGPEQQGEIWKRAWDYMLCVLIRGKRSTFKRLVVMH